MTYAVEKASAKELINSIYTEL